MERTRFRKIADLLWLTALVFPVVIGTEAQAQFQFRTSEPPHLLFRDIKESTQIGPMTMVFDSGTLRVDLEDGDFDIFVCIGNNGTSIMYPNAFCPLGTTAFILRGDADGDGEADLQSFWSVGNVQRAQFVAPGFANGEAGVKLVSAPANSDLRGLTLDTEDIGLTLFYDVLDLPSQVEYDITRYRTIRDYDDSQLQEMWDDIPTGEYHFEYPFLPVPGTPINVGVAKLPFVEQWPGLTPVNGLGAFRLTNDFREEAVEFDPRFQMRSTWDGISLGLGTVLPTDRLFFSLRDASTGRIVYPPYPEGTPDEDRAPVWLEGQLYAGEFTIGPFFELGFFDPGTEVIAYLELLRNNPAGGALNGAPLISYDYSERIFKWRVRFIDTYEGFSLLSFPSGTSEAQRAPDFDMDGDGFTNFEEFGFQTDPSRPEDNPSQIVLPEIVSGACRLVIQKRPNVGGRLDYFAETSVDAGVNWDRLTEFNPDWIIEFDNNEVLSIVSSSPFSAPSCLIRARVTSL